METLLLIPLFTVAKFLAHAALAIHLIGHLVKQ
jgi:hypothetical protein